MRWLFLGCFACTADVTVDGGSTGPLDAEEFRAAFADKYCEQLTTCGADADCASTSGSSSTTGLDCTFDAVNAQACLDAAWTCDDNSLPLPASTCADVFTCAGGTDTGTATGT